jgi:hypothetical protein
MSLMYLGFKLGSVERRNSLVVAKAVGDKSESSSGNIVKSVQSAVSFFCFVCAELSYRFTS